MKFLEKFKKKEPLLGIDIGASQIKIAQFDYSVYPPKLENWGVIKTPEDAFKGNYLERPELISTKISDLVVKSGFEFRKVAFSLPSTSVFIKTINIPKINPKDIRAHIEFEAGSFIPHKIEGVALDYHIVGDSGKNQLEVMVVAAKDEIIQKYVKAIQGAGLEVGIIDVDYFALHNIFKACYPKVKKECCAVLDIGSRFSSLNVVDNGKSVCTGDIAVGTDTIISALRTIKNYEKIEVLELFVNKTITLDEKAQEVLESKIEYMVAECARQIALMWGSVMNDSEISKIYLCGGASLIPNFTELLTKKVKIECEIFKVSENIKSKSFISTNFDEGLSVISLGLGLRYPGDRFDKDCV